MNAHVPARMPAGPVPVVASVGGEVLADSRDVATFFRRAHKNVLAALRNAEASCSPEFARLNFQPVHTEGQSRPVLSHYLLTKDGFSFAVLGFTGAEASAFKEAYIGEFNRMSAELARRSLPTVPAPVDPMEMLRDLDVLIPMLAVLAQRTKVAEAKVEEARPAVEFCDALADSDGLWGLRAAGKALQQGPDTFVKWLRGRGDLYDVNGGPVAKEHLIKRGLFKTVWGMHGGKPRPTTKVTGRGIVHYAKELNVRPPDLLKQALLPGL